MSDLNLSIPADDAPYAPLRRVLMAALADAARGKGADRHGGQLLGLPTAPFVDQQMMRNARIYGIGYPLGQAAKKGEEAAMFAARGEPERARAELLGAINYLAGAVLLLEGER